MKLALFSFFSAYFLGFCVFFPQGSWSDPLLLSLIFFLLSFMGIVFGGIFTSRLEDVEGSSRFSFAFYKVIAFFVFGFLGECLSFYSYSIALYVLWLSAFAFTAYIYRKEWLSYFRSSIKDIAQVEIGFFVIFFLALTLFGFRGLIFGGEKPMDLQFLHLYQKLPAAPHWEPWSWGERIKYYVLGFRILGLFFPQFLFSTGMAGYFYPISMCLIFSQTLLATYAFFFAFVKRRVALISSILLIMAPNFVSTVVSFVEEVSFQNFWRVSRLFESGAFTEFPVWSFLFGDLHPHLMGTPLVISIFTLFTYLRLKAKDSQFFPFALSGILMAILLGINIWDALLLSLLILLELVFSGRIFYLFKERLSREYGIFAFFFITLSLGFLTQIGGRKDVTFSIAGEHVNTLRNYVWHYGFWWGILVLSLAIALWQKKEYFSKFYRVGRKKVLLYLLKSSFFLLIPLVVWAISSISLVRLDVAVFYAVLTFFSFLLVEGQRNRFFVLIFFCLSFITVGIEHFVIMDRVNTLFKFHYSLWVLFALPCSLIFVKHLMRIHSWSRPTFGLVFLGLMLSTNAYLLVSVKDFPMERGSQELFNLYTPNLLERFRATDREAVNYLLRNERNPVTILEAPSQSYNYHAPKVGISSGHPSYLAWEGHLRVRGIEKREIQRRRELANRIYRGEVAKLRERLKEEGIDYVFIGPRERKTFKKHLSSLVNKMSDSPEHFQNVLQQKASTNALYVVK